MCSSDLRTLMEQNQAYGVASMQRAHFAGSANHVDTAGSMTKSPEPPRGQLERAVDGIANEVSSLGILIDGLEQRLSAVLQPSMPQPASPSTAQAGAGSPTSPATDYIVTQRLRIEDLQRRVQDIASRLDT